MIFWGEERIGFCLFVFNIQRAFIHFSLVGFELTGGSSLSHHFKEKRNNYMKINELLCYLYDCTMTYKPTTVS